MSTKSHTVTCSESRYWMTLSNAESRVLLFLPEHDFFFLPTLRPETSLGSDSQSESLKSMHYDILVLFFFFTKQVFWFRLF